MIFLKSMRFVQLVLSIAVVLLGHSIGVSAHPSPPAPGPGFIHIDEEQIDALIAPGIVGPRLFALDTRIVELPTFVLGTWVRGGVCTGTSPPDRWDISPCDIIFTPSRANRLDHGWIQPTTSPVIWDLGLPSNSAIVFPAIDHPPMGPAANEALEFTVWGSNDPNAPFPGGWALGTLTRIYAEGWVDVGAAEESDDFASLWTFPGTFRFVAVYANFSIHISPDPGPFENQCGGQGAFCSFDAEIDAVGRPNLFPIANAGPDKTTAEGNRVSFNGSESFDPDGDPLTYEWDFGDGSRCPPNCGDTDTQNPTHRYADNGNFTVTLTVKDGRGGSATDTADVTVNNIAPIVKAGRDKIAVVGELVRFSGSFIDPGADTHEICWDFGDDTSPFPRPRCSRALPSALFPTHTYSATGVFSVTFTVIDDDGGIGQDTLKVAVSPRGLALSYPETLQLDEVKHVFIARHIAAFTAEGAGIMSIAVEIFDLRGRKVFSDEALGNELIWLLRDDRGKALANGVYLYMVTVRGFDGSAIRREVRKLVVLR